MKTLRTMTLLAFVALGTIPQLARAATLTYSNDDLFLAFTLNSGSTDQGAGTDYVVDLGQASLYKGSNFSVTSIGNIGADLAATFGDDWNTSTDLTWSIFGGVPTTDTSMPGGDGPDTLYVAQAESVYGTEGTPYPQHLSSQSSVAQSKIPTMAGGFANGVNTSTANSDVATTQSTSSSTSYAFVNPVGGYANSLGSFADGTGATQLDLFRMASSSTGVGTYEGSFQIDDSGDLSFTTSPETVPEPSSTVLISVGVGLVALVVRRRRAAL